MSSCKKLTCKGTLRQMLSEFIETFSHVGIFDPALWTNAISLLYINIQCVVGMVYGVLLETTVYSAGVYHSVSDQIQKLQNYYTTPNENLGGEGSQTDKHLPQSPFTGKFFT